MQSKDRMKEGEARKLQHAYISDHYTSIDQVTEALARAGLESFNLILGIDFTKRNEWTGKYSCKKQNLHPIGTSLNPYEQAISIIGKTLAPFAEDNLIPCFGFGDSSTHDQEVFGLYPDERLCNGFEEVLSRYREINPNIRLAGPRSFAHIVKTATAIVERSGGQYHHVLMILANGQVTRTRHGRLSPQEKKTMDAIVEASKFPLSIILVGVGDGPWDKMKEFFDNIPTRAFDNFQFVNFAEIMSNNISLSRKEAAFALEAFMKIPSQYKAAVALGLLGSPKANAPRRVSLPTPPYGSAYLGSPSSTYDNQGNRENVLPLSWKDLRASSLTWNDFIRYTSDSVVNIPPKYHGALLILCGSFLGYQAKSTTAPFEFRFKYSTNAPQSLVLPFGEAFKAFFPEMTQIAKFMLCYFLTLMLVVPLQSGLQIFCMLLLLSAPLFYFPELVRNASVSGVDVACGGTFKLPLIGFATLGAVGLSLICGLVTLLMVYLSWRFLYKGKSRIRGIKVSLDDLCEILQG